MKELEGNLFFRTVREIGIERQTKTNRRFSCFFGTIFFLDCSFQTRKHAACNTLINSTWCYTKDAKFSHDSQGIQNQEVQQIRIASTAHRNGFVHCFL
jgi:hypothetical protein